MRKSKSIAQLVDYFDKHDLGGQLNRFSKANFKVNLQGSVCLFPLNASLANKVNELAKLRKTSSEKLISAWIREKIRQSV